MNSQFTGFDFDQAMFVEDGMIKFIGDRKTVLKKIKLDSLKIHESIHLQNKNVLPSFIECHTHTVYSGSRAEEFELRNNGVSYLEIAQKGGGILSTMRSTRETSQKKLIEMTKKRVDQFLKQGVSTVEIKSGYALDLKNELKILKVIQQIPNLYTQNCAPHIVSTFLGAHAKPPEFASYIAYLDFLATELLPVIKKKKLSQRVDIFIEKNFFESHEAFDFLKKSKEMGFDIVIHANQLSHSGGAELALELNAMSADHVIHLSEETIRQFSQKSTVAVLLPAADLYMKCPYPAARKLIDAGACVALATDFNPGSCPTQDLSLVGLLARLEMKMTLPEVFKAYTLNAAKALGLEQVEGDLQVGKKANFICTEASLTDFFYSAGNMPEHQLFIRGNRILLS